MSESTAFNRLQVCTSGQINSFQGTVVHAECGAYLGQIIRVHGQRSQISELAERLIAQPDDPVLHNDIGDLLLIVSPGECHNTAFVYVLFSIINCRIGEVRHRSSAGDCQRAIGKGPDGAAVNGD